MAQPLQRQLEQVTPSLDTRAPSGKSHGLIQNMDPFLLPAPMTAKSSFGRKIKRQAARVVGPPSRSIHCTPPPVRVVFSTTALVRSVSFPVNSVAWAPHDLGAILACASSDGKVSVLTFKSTYINLHHVVTQYPLTIPHRRWLLGRLGFHRPCNGHKCRLLVAFCPPWIINNTFCTTSQFAQRGRIADRCSQTVCHRRVRQFD